MYRIYIGALTITAMVGLCMAGGEDCPARINLTGAVMFAAAVVAGLLFDRIRRWKQ